MQSSQLEEARKLRDEYTEQYAREAFEAGYDEAHGIACHVAPRLGDHINRGVALDDVGDTVTLENIAEYHELLCYAAEQHSRCYAPWELTAHEINSLDETEGEGASEEAWEAYEAGVSAAIAHDLAGYEYDEE